MKGQWCDYNKNRFCQESAGCSGCEIYLRRDSNSQETNNHAVLQSVISPNLPFSSDALQTRAGVTTYSIPPLLTPVCKLAPTGADISSDNPMPSCLRCGEIPQGASIHQDAINTIKEDEFGNTTRQACSRRNNGLCEKPLYKNQMRGKYVINLTSIVMLDCIQQITPLAQCSRAKDDDLYVDGSSPSGRIPADVVHSSLSDTGAGQYFSNTIEPPNPAPIIIMGGN